MSATTTDIDRILDEMEDHSTITGTEALSSSWVLLSRVPKADPLYARCAALMTVTDALIRAEEWQPEPEG
ncbi:MAG: hypothetical protein GX604_05995 [Actinobacteria bacterium]|nr:hypothetical protein [Actinomycetota bacterium]